MENRGVDTVMDNLFRSLRMLRGIECGLSASVLMGCSRKPGDLFSRWAVLKALEMYSLGGGIDEGASALFEGWDELGRETLRLMKAQDQIPEKYTWEARSLGIGLDGN